MTVVAVAPEVPTFDIVWRRLDFYLKRDIYWDRLVHAEDLTNLPLEQLGALLSSNARQLDRLALKAYLSRYTWGWAHASQSGIASMHSTCIIGTG